MATKTNLFRSGYISTRAGADPKTARGKQEKVNWSNQGLLWVNATHCEWVVCKMPTFCHLAWPLLHPHTPYLSRGTRLSKLQSQSWKATAGRSLVSESLSSHLNTDEAQEEGAVSQVGSSRGHRSKWPLLPQLPPTL